MNFKARHRLSKLCLVVACAALVSTAAIVQGKDTCAEMDKHFSEPQAALNFLREAVESGQRLDKACIFAGSNTLPYQYQFIVPFYWIKNNADNPAYLQTRDFVETERLFHAGLILNTAFSGQADRALSYQIVLYEDLAPVSQLPFLGSNINPPDIGLETDNLAMLRCLVQHDHITLPFGDGLKTAAVSQCMSR